MSQLSFLDEKVDNGGLHYCTEADREWLVRFDDETWEKIVDTANRHEALARKRNARNYFAADNRLIRGYMGEACFSHFSNIPMDWTPTGRGDGGIDFVIPTDDRKWTLDVKAANKPRTLMWMSEYRHEPADQLVLCGADIPSRRAWLRGWQNGYKVKSWPLEDVKPKPAYACPTGLRKMSTLFAWIEEFGIDPYHKP